jgi:hypothetical protein
VNRLQDNCQNATGHGLTYDQNSTQVALAQQRLSLTNLLYLLNTNLVLGNVSNVSGIPKQATDG